MMRGKGLSQEVVALKKPQEHPTVGEIVEAVRRVFGVNEEPFWNRRQRH